MPDERGWVVDTSVYTHLCRAGHGDLLTRLAHQGPIAVPGEVQDEIDRGRESYAGIPAVSDAPWAQLVVLTYEEVITAASIKAEMGGAPGEHLGECEVIAVAYHRRWVALLDEREAIAQAELLGVPWRDTLWVVVAEYKRSSDREAAEATVDDLLQTDMRLPIRDGKSLFALAYEEAWLP